jgi:hypothetical protein
MGFTLVDTFSARSRYAVNAKISINKNNREVPFMKDFANNKFRDRCSRKDWGECGGQIFARNIVRAPSTISKFSWKLRLAEIFAFTLYLRRKNGSAENQKYLQQNSVSANS